MLTTSKLRAMPYAQAYIKHEPNRITLVSYVTEVAAIIGGVLVVRGLYSATTRRHIGCFVKEYANIDYQTAKMLCNDGMEYNIHTGEVRNLF
jgi:hypothetical protein